MKTKRALPIILSFIFAFASLVATVSTATAEVLDTPWSGGGTGTTTVISDGSVSPAAFNYDDPGPFSGFWDFDTVANSTRTVVLKYTYIGFHSFFQVTVTLDARVDTTIYPLENDGPVNCCTTPSGGFSYTGYVVLPVLAGEVYGFDMTGSHFDLARQLKGTLVVDELNKDDCKKGGWQTYEDNSGAQLFKNQGDCVSFVETGGLNEPGQNQPNN